MSWYALPFWIQYLTQGLLLSLWMAVCAVTVTKAGRNPYWALLSVIPYVMIIAIWVFAFVAWPKGNILEPKRPRRKK